MQEYSNTYRQNSVTGATPNPLMQTPDAIDDAFAEAANDLLCRSVELIRVLAGAHQSAVAIVIQKDWHYVRKFFSLSTKYEAWKDYNTPAVGVGVHSWLLEYNKPVRYTQAELEQHPRWLGFGTEAAKHPPMRGWMAAPIRDAQGQNWGLLQLSDKYEGEFTEADEANFVQFTDVLSLSLDALWTLRNLRKQVAAASAADTGEEAISRV